MRKSRCGHRRGPVSVWFVLSQFRRFPVKRNQRCSGISTNIARREYYMLGPGRYAFTGDTWRSGVPSSAARPLSHPARMNCRSKTSSSPVAGEVVRVFAADSSLFFGDSIASGSVTYVWLEYTSHTRASRNDRCLRRSTYISTIHSLSLVPPLRQPSCSSSYCPLSLHRAL
ncbi:hypothetical protein PLICRDRAFT_530502 [Plicaturopsis crispa FD-325 SS-3]|nr:hypothetical protein PLICRDRAFT_530502 [Plicaturopsis crispa FD-325 SS-3]